MRTMDFTTEQPDCCQVGDYLEVEENQLPTSYWYMLEHAYGASTNYKNRERLQTARPNTATSTSRANGCTVGRNNPSAAVENDHRRFFVP